MSYPDQQPQQMQAYAPAYLVPVPPKASGTAITSMILGILSFFPLFVSWVPVIGWFTPLFPLAAVILGHVALGQIKRRALGGRGMAVTGLVLGYIFLVIDLAFVVLIAVVGALFLTAVGTTGGLSG